MNRRAWGMAILLILTSAVAARAFQEDIRVHADKPDTGHDWTDLMSSMEKMDVAMSSVASSGNNDADFVRLMLPHHQAAIDMAKTQLLYGRDSAMRRLAQEIITDQQSEIELMQLWLKQHGPESQKMDPTPPSDVTKEH